MLFASANAQHVAISNSDMNVLYVGIENRIDIAAEGLQNTDLILHINSGGLITEVKNEPGKYIIRISQVGSAKITVSQKLKNGKEKVLREQLFRVKRIPDPIILVGNYKGGIIEHNTLKSTKGLVAQFDGLYLDFYIIINSFTISTCRNGIIYSIENNGPSFHSEARMLIDSARSGDVIVFDNIRVVQPGGSVRKLGAIAVYVDGLLNRTCADGKMKIPMYPVFSAADSSDEESGYSRITLNCNCDCIDEAKGSYKEGRKDGWWEYNKITDKETTTVRKEFYNKDTVTQQFYEDGILVKRVTIIDKKRYGTYDEFYPNGIQKIHGQYVIDTISADSVMQINPITLEEELLIEYRTGSVRSGEWFFYDIKGIVVRKEVYNPKKNRWAIDK